MLRSMMQAYVTGSDKAVALYQKAFDAEIISSYPNEDGTYYHCELNVYGQVLAVAEASSGTSLGEEERVPGNTMQFCLHFGEGNADKVKQGFAALQEGSRVLCPLGPAEFSPCMVDFIDRFGVRWCLFE